MPEEAVKSTPTETPTETPEEPSGEPEGEPEPGGEPTEPTEPKEPALGKRHEAEKKPDTIGAPEKYELSFAEGQEPDAGAVDMFEKTARELNLSNAAAQKLVTLYETLHEDLINRTSDGWYDSLKDDQEFGGGKLTGNLELANRFLSKYGTPELIDTLWKTGLANHPEMVRVFVRAARAVPGLKEDSIKGDGAPGATPKSPDDLYRLMYPTMFKGKEA